MKIRRRVIVGMLGLALLLVLSGGGCGGTDQTEETGANAALLGVLSAGLEDFSPADINDTATGNLGATGMDSAALYPEAPPWWLYLHPLRRRAGAEAREIIEAPAQIAYWLITHPVERPVCVIVNNSINCPLDPNVPGDTCNSAISFTSPCSVTFTAQGTAVTLQLSGALTREAKVVTASTAAGVWDGKWTANLTALNFKVTDPGSGKYLIYNGLLKSQSDGTAAAIPYDWDHTWVADGATPVSLTDSYGNMLSANGVRELEVLPGESAEQHLNTYPTWTVPGKAPLHLHREVDRYLTLDGNTATLKVNAKITQLDLNHIWRRTGDYTLYRMSLTQLKVNGLGTITSPNLKVGTVQLIGVVIDLTSQAPVSGTAIVTLPGGLIYTLAFSGACSLHWADNQGNAGDLNYCSYDSYLN